MKNALLVLVIAAAAGGGWWYAKRSAAPAEADPATSTDLPGPEDQPGALPGPAATTSDLPGPAPAPAGLPAAVQADLNAAEALWAEAAAATPDDPTRDARAPRMARLYTGILRATYGQPAAEAAADRLVADRLAPLGRALFLSRNRYDDELFAVHTVQSGDVPANIGKKFGIDYRYLNRLRGRDINDGNLRVGEALKVVQMKAVGGTYLYVSKSRYLLDLYVGGVFAKRYRISIGAPETPTPIGKTEVTNLVYNPPWTRPTDNQVLPHGHPENILGGVWIALAPDGIQGKTGIGLHGYTGEDRSLQKQASNGCLRLDNDEIQELANIIGGPGFAPCVVEIVE